MSTIPPLSAVSPAAAPAAGEEFARLVNGGVAEARIVAIAQGGLLRVLLDNLPTALSAPAGAAFAAGDRIALKRGEGAAGGLEIVRLQPGEAAAPELFERVQGRALPAILAPTIALRDAAAGDRPAIDATRNSQQTAMADLRTPAPVANAIAEARQALAPMAARAMAGQMPLPAFFDHVEAALAQPAHVWPLPLRAALQAVADHGFDPEAPDAAQTLRRAVESVGVFFEANVGKGATPAQGGADLKGALLALRGLLGSFVETSAPVPTADPALETVRPALPGVVATIGEAGAAERPDEALQLLRHALDAAQAVARGDVAPAGEESVRANGGRAGAAQTPQATPSTSLEGGPQPNVADRTASAQFGRVPTADGALLALEKNHQRLQGAAPRLAEPSETVAARPPLRGELPPMHRAEPGDLGPVEPRAQATQLLREVDGALDRLRLLQFASLDDRPPIELARDPLAQPMRQWQLELPLALQPQAAALPLMIERDGGGGAEQGRAGASWRMRFSTDTAELGAIDVAVTFRDGRVDVRFWADRAETSALIDEARMDLATRIENAAAPVDAIRCQLGRRAAPRPAPAKPGQFMDFRS